MLQFNFNPFPVLETERCILNKVSTDDACALFKIRSDERVMRYIRKSLAKDISEMEILINTITEGWQKNEGISWAIRLKNSASLIGMICFWRNDNQNHRGEIGYTLQADLHRKGIMQEVITSVIEYGFLTLQFHTIMAITAPKNSASQKLLLRCGFIQEAHFKENYCFDGKFLDSTVFGLINPNKLK